MQKIIFFLIVCTMCIHTSGYSQDWQSKYRKLQQRMTEKEGSRKNAAEEIEQMNQSWQQAEMEKEVPPPLRDPKPVTPINFSPADTNRSARQNTLDTIPYQVTPQPKVDRATNRKDNSARIDQDYTLDAKPKSLDSRKSFEFLGRALHISYDASLQFTLPRTLSKSKVSTAWQRLAHSSADEVLLRLMYYAHYMSLNDWGYCLMVNHTAKQLYPNDPNAQTLFNVYGLAQSGYQVKLGQHNNRLHLMMPTEERLYGHTFLMRGSTKYYIVDINGTVPQLDKAHILDMDFPYMDDQVGFAVYEPLKLGMKPKQRQLSFQYRGETYRIPVTLDQSWVEFYQSYPFTDWHVQLSAPISPLAEKTLVAAVRKIVSGKPQVEAANMILRMVQTAFPYKTDRQQFGQENYLFSEEMLYYPYSDCEDRSALYAYLVQKVLNLDVVGLLFPGHATAAVAFTGSVEGLYVTHNGKRYTICDPTYMYADIGALAPQVKSEEVRIIAFN